MNPIAVDAAGAARLLAVSEPTIHRLIASGALRSFKVGASRRIRVADVERYAAELVEAQTPEPKPAEQRSSLREVKDFFASERRTRSVR